jgi:thiol-disulfide isomerase/thioredoxin
MGKLLPSVDIRAPGQLGELEKRIAAGPITLVLIYADWCGHCQRFKPMMDQLESCPGRSVQMARVRDDVLPQSPLANIPNEGYPSLMLIKPDGTPVTFKNKEGSNTNVIPEHTNMVKMTTLVRNAGTPQGMNLLEETVNEIEEISPLGTQNSPFTGASNEPPAQVENGTPKNIVADRLSRENISRLNANLVASKNALLKEATKPAIGGGFQQGGGLLGELLRASQTLAPAAALFLAASATNKSRRGTRRRRGRGRSRKGRK